MLFRGASRRILFGIIVVVTVVIYWNGLSQIYATISAADASEDVNTPTTQQNKKISHVTTTTMMTSPILPKNNTKEFLHQNCDLTGTSWYPTGDDESWQLRAPYVLVLGAKKAGTTSLFEHILQHPRIDRGRRKELYFFSNVGNDFGSKHINPHTLKVNVRTARAQYYNATGIRPQEYFPEPLVKNDTSNKLLYMEATPDYLNWHNMSQRIMCVVPWVKLIVVLRDPVTRSYSDYEFQFRTVNQIRKNKHGQPPLPRIPFETKIQKDLNDLKRLGMFDMFNNATLASSTDPRIDMMDDEVMKVWKQYHTIGLLGRSIYEPQLRVWFETLRQLGRTPKDWLYIVRTEDMASNLDETMRGVHSFLELPHIPLTKEEHRIKSEYASKLNVTTERTLRTLFYPHTQRLYDLLIREGYGDDWKDYWEKRLEEKEETV